MRSTALAAFLSVATSLAGIVPTRAAAPAAAPLPSGPQSDGPWRKVILDADHDADGDGKIDDTLVDVMEMAIAPDGRMFLVERAGKLKLWHPDTRKSEVVGTIKTFTGLEDGLLGIALDRRFADNGWLYLFYSAPETQTDAAGRKTGENRLARFTFRDGRLDPASEKILVRVATQRDECCHSGGSVAVDDAGNVLVSTGDNTHPHGDSGGYAPIDERPGKMPWNALKSGANPNDLRGKILRVHPEPDGTVTIPKGNLFPPGTPGTRPEIYAMGCRNPFRLSVDPKSGAAYWGEVGPDAGGTRAERGPAGFDEINQALTAGNFGWPMFIADNKPYVDFDYATKKPGVTYDPLKPVNNSQYNTGAKELPPARSALVWYPYGPSTRFPAVNGEGGRTAMAGPVYHFDPKLASPRKLPKEFDHTLFIYEWSRNWIIAVHLDEKEQIARKPDGSLWMERFAPKLTMKRPMDMELGPDGCLYVLENGSAWQGNKDTQLVRIEHHGAP